MNTPPDERHRDRIDEILADRALQGLDPDEQAELERLVAEFDVHPVPLELTVAEIGLALDRAQSDELPRSLLEVIETDADAFFHQRSRAIPRRSVVGRVLPWLVGLAASALLIAWPWLRNEPEIPLVTRLAGVTPVALTATEHPLGRGSGGKLVWSGAKQEGYLAIRGLAEVDPSQGVYQLWIFDGTRDDRYPVDGGTFLIKNATETTLVPVHPMLEVRKPTFFAVTLEPPGGVVVSDRKRILLTAAPAQEPAKN